MPWGLTIHHQRSVTLAPNKVGSDGHHNLSPKLLPQFGRQDCGAADL